MILFNFFRQNDLDSRELKIKRHTLLLFLYKSFGVIINFLLIRLSVDILGNEIYGVWLTIFSTISWVNVMDIGIGNGLRNKTAESANEKDRLNLQEYISTAYVSFFFISIVILVFFIMLLQSDWVGFLNFNLKKSASFLEQLSIVSVIVVISVVINFNLKLIVSLEQGLRNHSFPSKLHLIQQLLIFFLLLIASVFDFGNLVYYSAINLLIPIIVLSYFTWIIFGKKSNHLRPKISLFNKEKLKSLTNLGFSFFIIQIASIIVFSSDNIIISKFLGPEEVLVYNISYKYFTLITTAFSLIVAPYWSEFTTSFTKKNFEWIKDKVIKVQKIWLLVPIVCLAFLLFSDWFYKFWIGKEMNISLTLTFLMSLYTCMITYNMIYVNFINGSGKIKVQLITSIISIVINIPLSIYLAVNWNLGSAGVILATCICLSYSVLFRIIQYKKLITNTAYGIWNK